MPRLTDLGSILIFAASACSQSAALTPHDHRAQRVARLERIAVGCGLPAATLTLAGTDDVHFQPPADAEYERVDCVLKALKKTDIPMKMGFVGNETPDPENRR